jgi:hypothetical protein
MFASSMARYFVVPEELRWRPCHEAAIVGSCIDAEKAIVGISIDAEQIFENLGQRGFDQGLDQMAFAATAISSHGTV